MIDRLKKKKPIQAQFEEPEDIEFPATVPMNNVVFPTVTINSEQIRDVDDDLVPFSKQETMMLEELQESLLRIIDKTYAEGKIRHADFDSLHEVLGRVIFQSKESNQYFFVTDHNLLGDNLLKEKK